VVDRGSNRRISKNHIGGVKVSRIALSVVDVGQTEEPRSTTLKVILPTFTLPM
jgi:hypothetical protein